MSTGLRSSLRVPPPEFWFRCAALSYFEHFDADELTRVGSIHELRDLVSHDIRQDTPGGRVLADTRNSVVALCCCIRNDLLDGIDAFAPLKDIKNVEALNRFLDRLIDAALRERARSNADWLLALTGERDRYVNTVSPTGVAHLDWEVPPRVSRTLIVGAFVMAPRELRSFAAVARLLGISESNVKYAVNEFVRLCLNHLSDDDAHAAVVIAARHWQIVDYVFRRASKHVSPRPLTRRRWPEIVAGELLHAWRTEFFASSSLRPVGDAAIEDLMKRRSQKPSQK